MKRSANPGGCAGTLYVVATPIGNLEDITQRAVRILGEVDLVAAEDTRRTRALLSHLGIEKPVAAYYDAIERARSSVLLERLASGESIALVSDAGTPLIADPGYRIVHAARAAGIPVVAVPGACAPIALLSCAGLPTNRFTFAGFLPSRPGLRRRMLIELRDRSDTLVLFETARRLPGALADLAAMLGGAREAVIGRELTKKFEEILSGDLATLAARFAAGSEAAAALRGELVLAIAGAPQRARETAEVRGEACGARVAAQAAPAASEACEALEARLRARLAAGEPASSAARAVAAETGQRRSLVYRRAVALSQEKPEP